MPGRPSYRLPCLLALCTLALIACGGGSGGSAGSSAAASPAPAEPPDGPSYYGDAKPVIDRYCVACHRDDGIAPFALEDYQQVAGKRSAMIFVLEADTMPQEGYADLRDDERELLLNWLNDGAREGDPSDAPQIIASQYSYYTDTKQIIDDRCVSCHREGDIAPFALDSYEAVYAVRAAAAFAIRNGSMPPWPPTTGYTKYHKDRSLTPLQRHLLLSWLDSGAAPGNPGDAQQVDPPAAAPEPEFNLTLTLPAPYTPSIQPDDHRCFAIPWPEPAFSYVTNVDVLPDVKEEVHHVIVAVGDPANAHIYYDADGADGNPGWRCLGAPNVDGAPLPRQIGGWVPGAGRDGMPADTGIGIEPGSVMVVQMHYNTLVTEPQPDQSSILFAKTDTVDTPASSFLLADPRWLAEGGMPIEAGDPDAHHEMTFPAFALAGIFGSHANVGAGDPWVLHAGFLHMHSLGKSGRITLIRNDGSKQVLLDIRDWDFDWQGTYGFEKQVLIKPADNIKLECRWDNSQENQIFVDGEQLPTAYVEWGDDTQDEMCLMSVFMTKPRTGYGYSYQPSLYIESPRYRQRFRAGDLVPLQLLFNNFTLQDPGTHNDSHNHGDGTHAEADDNHRGVYSGHYHVYLDTEDDNAEHLTAWDDSYYYQLPEDLMPGPHSLRINLRGTDHHALGIEQRTEIEIIDELAVDARSLVDVNAWQAQDTETDSLADHRPPLVECPDNAWYNEDDALEVETGYCNYLSLRQPSLTAISAGDTIRLSLWHGQLRFDEPTGAHVAVSIDGQLLWEQEVEVPSTAQIFDLRIPAPFTAPAGSKVEYHLHNHGYNSWTLLQLAVEH